MWVIARRAERLEELKAALPCPVRVLALDLSKPESWKEYEALLEKEKPAVDLLINASGFGIFKEFDKSPLDGYYEMIALNDSAVVAMTYVSLPYMETGSKIWNICSVAAFQPVPYINVYAASKSFALSFTRALNVELKPRGIKALSVCPYWTKTEFFDRAVSDNTISYYECMYDPEKVVETVASQIRNQQSGFWHTLSIPFGYVVRGVAKVYA